MTTLPALFSGHEDRPLFLEPDGTVRTHGEVWDSAARVAGVLAAHGARRGDRIAVQIEKSPLTLELWLACAGWGFVLAPFNTAYTDAELTFLLGDARPAVMVSERPPAPGGWATLAPGAFGGGDPLPPVEVGPDDPVALLYTSGTTGRPKGASLTQHNLASNAATLVEAWGFTPDDVLVHSLPMFHAHGLFVAANCVMAAGASMRFLERFDADEVIRLLPTSTVFMGVPTHYTRMLGNPRLDRSQCERMRLFTSGSAPLLATTHEEFTARTGHAILERYGMTETVMLTSNPLAGPRKPGTVGPPLPGVEVRVVDPDGDGVGGVEVRGPSVITGYWQRPDLADTEFTPDGFFRTGDLGRFDADGYLELVGRSKDLVITGGLNVHPKEVEEVLDAIDGVAESAVIGLPDADFGEAVTAVVVLAPGGPSGLDEAAIRSAARERLAAFKVPKRVVIVGALPRNGMGKVEKARLRTDLA